MRLSRTILLLSVGVWLNAQDGYTWSLLPPEPPSPSEVRVAFGTMSSPSSQAEGIGATSWSTALRLDAELVNFWSQSPTTALVLGVGVAITHMSGDAEAVSVSEPTFGYDLTGMPVTVRLAWRWSPLPWLDLEAGAHVGVGPTFVAVTPGSSADGQWRATDSGHIIGLATEYGLAGAALGRWGDWSAGVTLRYLYGRQTFAYTQNTYAGSTPIGVAEREVHIDQIGLAPSLFVGYRW